MAQAARNLLQIDILPEPANSNYPTDGVDLWRLLIDRLKPCLPQVAIFAIHCRLKGWTVDEFCDAFVALDEQVRRYGAVL